MKVGRSCLYSWQDIEAHLLENHGTMELIAEGPRRTQRIIQGELRVRVMLLGAIAERIIYKRAHELLDEEARVLSQYLREQG